MRCSNTESDSVTTLYSCILYVCCFSGGNKLDVRGSYLGSVQKPQFIVYVNNENRTGV